MGRFIVGLGLVIMLSALAYFTVVADDLTIPVSAVNSASALAFWVFVAGTVVAVVGGLKHAR